MSLMKFLLPLLNLFRNYDMILLKNKEVIDMKMKLSICVRGGQFTRHVNVSTSFLCFHTG